MSLTTELIERLRKEADGYKGNRSKRAVRVKHILREAADTIETLSAKVQAANMEQSTAYYNGGWIPVSERLPEDKLSVLVWCPQYKNIYCAYLEKEQWWIFGAFVQIVPNEVTAWMPLPESYKAESEDKE